MTNYERIKAMSVEEPNRLTYKQAMYDYYVSCGSGDICFAYGMSGHCGAECPEFGMRDGCAGMTDDEEEVSE